MNDNSSGTSYIELTASIVSAYVSNNPVPAQDLSALINQVHAALTRVSSGQGEVASEPLKPAISVKKSITADYIVCAEIQVVYSGVNITSPSTCAQTKFS